MPVNIDDIKKLPDQEKLKLFDQLLENMDEDAINEFLETEEDHILRERLAQYEKGEMTFRSWDEVRKTIEENLKKQQVLCPKYFRKCLS
jgi:putative addiction module component (TIGR02574 family)